MQFDPIALINQAPATALCVLVYLELRWQRVESREQRKIMQGLNDTLTSLQTSLELLAQLVGVKIKKRPPTPVPLDKERE